MIKAIRTGFSIVMLLYGLLAFGQEEAGNPLINWLSWEEALERSTYEKKKIFVDLYTEWCGWCKKMDSSTFKQKDIVNFINENYYPIKFDAQNKTPIEIKEKVYKFKNGYNELAVEITYGRMQFPSLIFMDEEFNTIQSIPGYRKQDELEMILVYFAENFHTNMPWSTFQRKYARMKMPVSGKSDLQHIKGKN